MPTNTWSTLPNRVTGEVLDFSDVNDMQNNEFFDYTAISAEHNVATTATGVGGQGAHKIIYNCSDNTSAHTNDSIFLNLQTVLATVSTYNVVDTRYDWRDRYITFQGICIMDLPSAIPGGTQSEYVGAGEFTLLSAQTGWDMVAGGTRSYSAGIFYSDSGAASSTSTAARPALSVYGDGLSDIIYINVDTAGQLIVGVASTDMFSTSALIAGLVIAGPQQDDI